MDIIDKLADTAIESVDHAFDRMLEKDHVGADKVLDFAERLTKMCHSIEDHSAWLQLNLSNADTNRYRVFDRNPSVLSDAGKSPTDEL